MTLKLHTDDGDGVFDVLGKAFHAMDTLNTAAGDALVPAGVVDFMDQVDLLSGTGYTTALTSIPNALTSWQNAAPTLATRLAASCQSVLIQMVTDDSGRASVTLTDALTYLIDQMESNGDYVDANTVAQTTTAGTNVGDVSMMVSLRSGDGRDCEHALAETIAVTAGTSLTFTGESSASSPLYYDWPKGSGISATVSITDPASSLLSNGDFSDQTITGVPDDWIVAVGSASTVGLTSPEVQTVTISGSPSAAWYVLQWTNAAGVTRATEVLAYNASGSTVQTALRKIEGLEVVTVATTGTSPNFTHTITMTGVSGNPAQLTSINGTTGGTITHATITSGVAGSFRGQNLRLTGTGSELTTLYHAYSPTVQTPYFFCCRILRDATATSGTLDFALVNGIGGTVVQDDQGHDLELTVSVSSLSTSSWSAHWFAFQAPADASNPLYLRIKATSALPSGGHVWIADCAVIAGTALYSGGPYVAAIAGQTDPADTDTWTVAVTNDRAGRFQEWFQRCFDMTGKGLLLLPVSGTTPIPDSLIS